MADLTVLSSRNGKAIATFLNFYVLHGSTAMLSPVRLSVCRLSSATFVHPTQAIEIFGNVFTPFGTFAICNLSIKILWRSSLGTPPFGD